MSNSLFGSVGIADPTDPRTLAAVQRAQQLKTQGMNDAQVIQQLQQEGGMVPLDKLYLAYTRMKNAQPAQPAPQTSIAQQMGVTPAAPQTPVPAAPPMPPQGRMPPQKETPKPPVLNSEEEGIAGLPVHNIGNNYAGGGIVSFDGGGGVRDPFAFSSDPFDYSNLFRGQPMAAANVTTPPVSPTQNGPSEADIKSIGQLLTGSPAGIPAISGGGYSFSQLKGLIGPPVTYTPVKPNLISVEDTLKNYDDYRKAHNLDASTNDYIDALNKEQAGVTSNLDFANRMALAKAGSEAAEYGTPIHGGLLGAINHGIGVYASGMEAARERSQAENRALLKAQYDATHGAELERMADYKISSSETHRQNESAGALAAQEDQSQKLLAQGTNAQNLQLAGLAVQSQGSANQTALTRAAYNMDPSKRVENAIIAAVAQNRPDLIPQIVKYGGDVASVNPSVIRTGETVDAANERAANAIRQRNDALRTNTLRQEIAKAEGGPAGAMQMAPDGTLPPAQQAIVNDLRQKKAELAQLIGRLNGPRTGVDPIVGTAPMGGASIGTYDPTTGSIVR